MGRPGQREEGEDFRRHAERKPTRLVHEAGALAQGSYVTSNVSALDKRKLRFVKCRRFRWKEAVYVRLDKRLRFSPRKLCTFRQTSAFYIKGSYVRLVKRQRFRWKEATYVSTNVSALDKRKLRFVKCRRFRSKEAVYVCFVKRLRFSPRKLRTSRQMWAL